MPRLPLTQDDALTWFVSEGWHDTEVEFTDAEIARIKAAQDEWEAVQKFIRDHVTPGWDG